MYFLGEKDFCAKEKNIYENSIAKYQEFKVEIRVKTLNCQTFSNYTEIPTHNWSKQIYTVNIMYMQICNFYEKKEFLCKL